MKRLFALGLALFLGVGSLYAQTAAAPAAQINKADLLQKISAANKGAKRMQMRIIQDTRMPDVMRVQDETIVEMDPANKIMHTVSGIKEYEVNMSGMMPPAPTGTTEEDKKKIEEYKKMQAESQKEMQRIADNVKKIKNEQYMMNNAMYLRLNDKWFKLEDPSFAVFWETAAKSGQEPLTDEKLDKLTAAMPAQEKELFKTFMKNLGSDLYRDDMVSSIAESSFEGKPVYVLELNNKSLVDTMTQALSALAKNNQNQNINISVANFKFKVFVDKNNYLPLAQQGTVEIVIADTQQQKSFKALRSYDAVFSYPTGKVQANADLASAKTVASEKEMQDILTEEMMKAIAPNYKP